ncbi:MAG: ATP-dependent DNA helicase [Thermoplasmata archaeon]
MKKEGKIVGADGLFPFEKLRAVQEDFLKEARECVKAGKFLMANAPTGIGKTAVALTASVEYGLRNGYVVFFMTSRQSQHRIAIETLARMRKKERSIVVADMIGKRSMCIAEPIKNSRFFEEICAASLRTHACKFARISNEIVKKAKEFPMDADEIIKYGVAKKCCPYLCAAEVGKDASVIVCDYNYLFSEISEIVLQKLGIDVENIVIVVDEAHNLPERIRANYTQMLNVEDFKEGGSLASKIDPQIANILRKMYAILSTQKFASETKLEREYFEKVFERTSVNSLSKLAFPEFLQKLDLLGAFLEKQGVLEPYITNIVSFLRHWSMEERGLLRFAKEDLFVCEMLDTGKIGSGIFNKAPAGIIMSATLYPLEMYRDLLGVPEGRCVLKYYSSPFPKENRVLLTLPHLTSRYDARGEEMYARYCETIREILNDVPGNIAIFYTSYQMMEEIGKRVEKGSERLHIYEQPAMTKSEKINTLKILQENRTRGGVLHAVLGGSLSEGIDFRDNLLSCVIIAGIPIPPPSLENTAIQEFLEESYGKEKGYAYARICPAFNKVLQAAGRCIRSENDRGVIFLLDTRFTNPRYRKYLPDDFQPQHVSKPGEILRNFFAKN